MTDDNIERQLKRINDSIDRGLKAIVYKLEELKQEIKRRH